MGSVLEAADAAFVSSIAAKVREAIGEASFVAAFAEGRALQGHAAFAEAVAWLDTLPYGTARETAARSAR